MDSNFKRMMIFIDETDKWHGVGLASAILDRLRKEGCAGATVLRGSSGFGIHRQVHTAALLDAAISLPVIVMTIDEADKIEKITPIIREMVNEGLLVIDDVQAIRCTKPDGAGQTTTQEMATQHLVEEYMDTSPMCIDPEALVEKVIPILLENHRAYLPVVNEHKVLLGMISSYDLVMRLLHMPDGRFHMFGLRGAERQKFSQDLRNLKVSEVMRTNFAAVQEKTAMAKAVSIMLHEKQSAMAVLQGQRIVGILRLPDVLRKAYAIEFPKT